MGILFPVFESKKILIFLNISFLTLFIMFFIVNITPHQPPEYLHQVVLKGIVQKKLVCTDSDFHSLRNNEAKCAYLKSHAPCVTQSYIDYLQLFYCTFDEIGGWRYVVLFIWLLVLFYLLGDTASTYFSPALESLSNLMNLSPAIAGVTLLSLGNGAPDVFSSIVSFMGNGNGDVGLNTVLGGASFVSCVVVGVLCIALHTKDVAVDKTDFVRDVCSYIVVLVWLLVVLVIGKINVWGSVAFASMYFVYVSVVYYSHTRRSKRQGLLAGNIDDDGGLCVPILSTVDRTEVCESLEEGELAAGKSKCSCLYASRSCTSLLIQMLELPLSLPRRLTIPLVSEEQWSKPYAVASVTLAPLLISALCNRQFGGNSPDAPVVIYGTGAVVGFTFGVVAFVTTDTSNRPRKFLFPWLLGSFFMSMIWSYITAQELVGLLVSLGFIFEISSAIIGVTVLAWGNSIGDLVTNLTIALNDGPGGAQIALSGCYAGPIFNILVGLGFSLVGKSWKDFPSPVVIASDPYVMETLGLLVVGLTWALVMLPRRGMKPDRLLGIGLLGVYVVSISFRLVETLGFEKH